MNNVILANYSVNKDTLALLSVAHPDYHTIAIETDRKLHIRKTPFQIIKAACLKGGSTYEGRRAAVTYLTGAKHKVPIPIHPTEHIYAFPTFSPTQFECSWIFHDHVHSITPFQQNCTLITFKNEQQLKLPVSYYTIENKCTELLNASSALLTFRTKKPSACHVVPLNLSITNSTLAEKGTSP
ncbi:competence protein ComK [Anaerobacillus sp. CMMVII]|uniref:competence protein ComK n=1 Tax=Anaerobacillus sp. CMMVII TaxID=2755588 RepID=UPI0021B7DF24|nr:competence protein ComK [Anaerobacillus sp. CMMVII]